MATSNIRRDTVVNIAKDLTEEYYRVNGVRVVNHTLADWGTCLARSSSPHNSTFRVFHRGVNASWDEVFEGYTYANLYDGDGLPPGGIRRKKRTTGFMQRIENVVKTLNPIQKYISKDVMISDYVTAKGGNGDMIFAFIMASWGGQQGEGHFEASFKIDKNASTKRIGGKTQVRNHMITMFPNTQASIVVQGENYQRYADAVKMHTDFLSIVTSARIIGLTEVGAENSALNYNIPPGALIPSSPITYFFENEELTSECTRAMSDESKPIIRQLLDECIKEMNQTIDMVFDDPAPSHEVGEGVGAYDTTNPYDDVGAARPLAAALLAALAPLEVRTSETHF